MQHIRFQEIAGALDSSLMTAAIAPVQNPQSNEVNSLNLTLKQSITLLESLRTCWKEDVLVLSCSDKFLRLSLQLLSRFDCIIALFCISLKSHNSELYMLICLIANRYTTWLSSGLGARKLGSTGSNPGSEWAIAANAEDFIYVCTWTDLNEFIHLLLIFSI